MNNKSDYTLEDLLLNESFLNFYFQKNEEDVLDWEDWLEEDAERTALAQQAFNVLDRLSLKWSKAEIEIRYQKVREELLEANESKGGILRHLSRFTWRYAAAASLLLFVASWFLFKQANRDSAINITPSVSAVENAVEEPLKRVLVRFYRLPDGTKVQLKAGSELILADDFGKTKRLVYLKGEAKIEVAHDADRPFMVKTDDVITTALGTVFVVKSSMAGQLGGVSLIEGKVKVEYQTANNASASPSITLTEGEQVQFETERKTFSEIEKLPSQIVNWQQLKILSIEKMRLSEVLGKLSESYQVHFEGVDKEMSNYIITGMFDTNLPLSDILDALAFSNDFKYLIKDKKVIINKKID